MTYFQFQHQYPTELSVISHFIGVRYPQGAVCHHCGGINVYHRTDFPRVFNCYDCGNTFSVFMDTIFEKSCTDLRKWFYAIHLFLNGKKGISGLQLQREIGVTYKTAWRMLRQIRLAMGNEQDRKLFEICVEIDETYVGGKPRKGTKNNKRGRGTPKTPVVGIVSRSDKRVFAKVALPNKEGKRLTSKQLLAIIKQAVKEDADVITDEFTSYAPLMQNGFYHHVINHSVEFARNGIHTNSIESFWATLKRGILGIYHSVSIQHLQHYVNEFCFRYNNRKNVNIFDLLLSQSIA